MQTNDTTRKLSGLARKRENKREERRRREGERREENSLQGEFSFKGVLFI